MSELESIAKLRRLPFHGTNGFGNCVTASKETINSIADEIEAEIAERYMPCPCDADGVPIRVGDRLALQYEVREKPSEVESITFDGEDWYFTSSDGFFNTAGFRHVNPRTLEDVLCDALADVSCMGDGIVRTFKPDEPYVIELADEIRAMFGEVRDD